LRLVAERLPVTAYCQYCELSDVKSKISFFFFFRRNLRILKARRLKLLRVSRPVRESLAFDTLHGKDRTFSVVNSELDPVAVTEIEFSEVSVQVLLGAASIDAFHFAFEN
jgi:hypothetical protein